MSRPARRWGRGRCHLGPFPDRSLSQPWPAASVPLTHVCLSPPPFEFSFPVSSCFPFFPPFLVSGSVCVSVGVSHLSRRSPSIFVHSRPHRLLLPTSPPLPPPLGGPLPQPRRTFQPPPPLRRPSLEPAAAVVGSRDTAGRLELESERSGAGGGWRGHPLTPLECGLGRPHEVGRRRSRARRLSRPETAGYICPVHGPHPERYPRASRRINPTPDAHAGPLTATRPDQSASPSHTRAAPALQSTGEAYLACSTGTPIRNAPHSPRPTTTYTYGCHNLSQLCDPQNLLSPRTKTSLTKTAALKVTSGSPNSDPQRRCSAEAAPKPGAPQPQTLPTHPSSCRPSQAKRPLGWAGAGA